VQLLKLIHTFLLTDEPFTFNSWVLVTGCGRFPGVAGVAKLLKIANENKILVQNLSGRDSLGY
jgi:hypothetical protein